jgi:glycosyltransferase involved in cell wall biosynthesis
MNILIVNATWYPSGGDWTYVNSITQLYEKHGHTIIPFAMKNEKNLPSKFEKYFIDKIDYNELNKDKGILNTFNVLSKSIYSMEAVKKINDLLDNHKVDIAQLNNIHNIQTPGIIPVLKKRKIPIVWRVLDYKLLCPNRTFLSNGLVCEKCFKTKYYNCFVNKCKKNSYPASFVASIESYFNKFAPFYDKVDIFLFQSEFSRNLFVKYGFDIKKTKIIENPYNCDNIIPQYTIKKSDRYILYFGRISKEKGLFTLFDAMKNLGDIKLIVVGDGPDSEECLNYIRNIKNISFIGPKWETDLTPILKNCEFVVVPSIWYDPNPYVVLQSFSFGKPVIASRIGGLVDMISNQVNGILFDANDSSNLSVSIKDLYFNQSKILELGRNARIEVEKKYNPNNYYLTSIKIFDNLINKN